MTSRGRSCSPGRCLLGTWCCVRAAWKRGRAGIEAYPLWVLKLSPSIAKSFQRAARSSLSITSGLGRQSRQAQLRYYRDVVYGMDVDGSDVPRNQELRCWKQLEDEAPDAIEPHARHACVRTQPLATGALSCGLGSKSKSLSDPARRPAPNPIWAGGRKTKKIGLGKDPPSLNQNFFSACTFLLCTTIATNHGSLDHRTPANSAGAIRSEDQFEEERL